MHAQVHTVTDLMSVAAEALRKGDHAALMDIIEISANWLQLDAEAAAQRAMLEAMIEVIGNHPRPEVRQGPPQAPTRPDTTRCPLWGGVVRCGACRANTCRLEGPSQDKGAKH